ncbi:Pentatricopeptide repeat-containing protein, putative [Babesia ovata]|uniref:Pentatricopeptide repeat-containing protein, putative n=1 Tax=Babesia ovata TaxID=189622 RepID=A0A2H6KDE4_9APIC|nr:Pentatricopeptide repeat-containing protein, putative [Babesia ovata]GBE61020.1 Pentatricopeptide repeat-containing protein, putative [Babesia ovata]
MGSFLADGALGSGALMAKGLAFYAGNTDSHNPLGAVKGIYKKATSVYRGLAYVSSVIPKPKASAGVNEAKQKKCDRPFTTFERVKRLPKEYAKVRKMFDECRALVRELQNKNVTPDRSAALSKELVDLEKQFEGEEKLASESTQSDDASSYKELVRKAKEFIQKHKLQKPTSSQYPDQGSSGVKGGSSSIRRTFSAQYKRTP